MSEPQEIEKPDNEKIIKKTVDMQDEIREAVEDGSVASETPTIPGIESIQSEQSCRPVEKAHGVHTGHNSRSQMEKVDVKLEEAKHKLFTIFGVSHPTEEMNEIFNSLKTEIHKLEDPNTAPRRRENQRETRLWRKRIYEEDQNERLDDGAPPLRKLVTNQSDKREGNDTEEEEGEEEEDLRMKKKWEKEVCLEKEEKKNICHTVENLSLEVKGSPDENQLSVIAAVHALYSSFFMTLFLKDSVIDGVQRCFRELFRKKTNSVRRLVRLLESECQSNSVGVFENILHVLQKERVLFRFRACDCSAKIAVSYSCLEMSKSMTFPETLQRQKAEECPECLSDQGDIYRFQNNRVEHIFTVRQLNDAKFLKFRANGLVELFGRPKWALDSFIECVTDGPTLSGTYNRTWVRTNRRREDTTWKCLDVSGEKVVDGQNLYLDQFSIVGLFFRLVG